MKNKCFHLQMCIWRRWADWCGDVSVLHTQPLINIWSVLAAVWGPTSSFSDIKHIVTNNHYSYTTHLRFLWFWLFQCFLFSQFYSDEPSSTPHIYIWTNKDVSFSASLLLCWAVLFNEIKYSSYTACFQRDLWPATLRPHSLSASFRVFIQHLAALTSSDRLFIQTAPGPCCPGRSETDGPWSPQ